MTVIGSSAPVEAIPGGCAATSESHRQPSMKVQTATARRQAGRRTIAVSRSPDKCRKGRTRNIARNIWSEAIFSAHFKDS